MYLNFNSFVLLFFLLQNRGSLRGRRQEAENQLLATSFIFIVQFAELHQASVMAQIVQHFIMQKEYAHEKFLYFNWG